MARNMKARLINRSRAGNAPAMGGGAGMRRLRTPGFSSARPWAFFNARWPWAALAPIEARPPPTVRADTMSTAIQRCASAAILLASALISFAKPASSLDARTALRNHSLHLTWVSVRQVRRLSGMREGIIEERRADGAINIYVSSLGKVFSHIATRSAFGGGRNGRRGGPPVYQAPEDEQEKADNVSADTMHWRIAGDSLLGVHRYVSGAQQLRATITAAGGAMTCALQIIEGREAGDRVLMLGRNKLLEVLSSRIENPSCEISAGNAFAQ